MYSCAHTDIQLHTTAVSWMSSALPTGNSQKRFVLPSSKKKPKHLDCKVKRVSECQIEDHPWNINLSSMQTHYDTIFNNMIFVSMGLPFFTEQRMNVSHLMNTIQIFSYPYHPMCGACTIYCRASRSCIAYRMINFLMGFSIVVL